MKKIRSFFERLRSKPWRKGFYECLKRNKVRLCRSLAWHDKCQLGLMTLGTLVNMLMMRWGWLIVDIIILCLSAGLMCCSRPEVMNILRMADKTGTWRMKHD